METLSTARRICRTDKSLSGCNNRKKGKKKKRTNRKHPDDFLRQTFPPVVAVPIPAASFIKEIEYGFINSVKNLAKLYGFKPNLLVTSKYPLCISELYNNALLEMRERSNNTRLLIVQEKAGYPLIATVKEINIDQSLFYIPLDALWHLHSQRKKEGFKLLLSVYSYLYHIAGMPLLNDHSYIRETYDMMKQSYEDNQAEFEPEEIQETMQSFTALRRIVPILNKEIANTENLNDFHFRIEKFVPAGFFDFKLLSIAKLFHSLWQQFPNESFTSNKSSHFLYPDEQEIIYSEQFFSFCWTLDGWMIDQLLEWVNCDLQEKSVFELPFSIQKFDIEHAEILHKFSYHTQLLNLLSELSDTLNELYE
jgi:hypothetical protein